MGLSRQVRAPEVPLRTVVAAHSLCRMSVQEIKDSLSGLPSGDLDEIAAFLFQLRHRGSSDYRAKVSRRLADDVPSHWLSPDEFERALDLREDR